MPRTLCLALAWGAWSAPACTQTVPAFPLHAAEALPAPPAPVLRPSEVVVPPLRAEGSVDAPALRAQGADNPALAAEVARLRKLVNTPGRSPPRVQGNAAWVLGLLYLHGIGVVASPAEAVRWFERARALGEPLAAAGLAWCEIEGCRGAANPAAARRWIALLRPVDLPRSQYLQWLVDMRLSPLQIATPGLRGEPAMAPLPDRQLLESAAQGGNIHALIELGFESVAANRPAEALAHFRAASPRSPAAAGNAALLSQRLSSTPAPRSPASATETFARAQRNHRGEGQPANFVEAIRLYRLAQGQGSAEARRMLELIFSRPGPDGQVDIAWMQQLAYVNLSRDVPALDSSTVRPALRREPTPLSDMLPPSLRR